MKKIVKIILIIIGIFFLLIIILKILPEKKTVTKIASLPSTAEILFVSNRDTDSRRNEIYSMDSNGDNITRITFSDKHHFIVGIDKSRRYILASRAEKDTHKPSGLGDEDKRSLWIIDLQTKQEKRLTDIKNNAEGDSFSPDGEWIVFMMTVKREEQADIYKIKKDGTGLTKLTDTKTVVEGDPAWSHNGKEIVFASLDGLDENPRYIIKTMDTNGNNMKVIYDSESRIWIQNVWPPGAYDPTWSPNNEWIVCEKAVEYDADNPQNFGSGIWHIFKIKRDGSEVIDLSLAGGHTDKAEYLPSFSPDGKSIIFGSLYKAKNLIESHNDIFIMDSETGESTRLTTDSASNMSPVWIY